MGARPSAVAARILSGAVQPLLHGVEHVLVFPARDAAVVGWSCIALDAGTCGQAEDQYLWNVMPFSTVVNRQIARLPGRASVLIALGVVDEVLLVEATLGLAAGGDRLGHQRHDAGLVALQDLLALEVAAIGQHDQFAMPVACARLFGHRHQLIAVVADVGDLVRHDQVVLRIDRSLHVVADDAGAAPLVAIDRASGSVNETCRSALACICLRASLSRCICSFSFAIFSLQPRDF